MSTTSERRWPLVPLRELLTQAVDAHPVQMESAYPNFGIYSFGRGLFVKPPILGVSTSARTLFRAREGQFIYSRLFAFEGAYGLVPRELDGSFVSNEYPMFDCNTERVLPDFLGWYFRLSTVWRQVAQLSTGLGDRRTRVQPEQILTHSMPLPPLAEQRRLVALIDAVAARVEEAKQLREQAEASVTKLLISMAHRDDLEESQKIAAGWQSVALEDIINLVEDPHTVVTDLSYPNLGIYSFGRGLFKKPPIEGMATSARTLFKVKSGQFIYSRLFAFEGAYGIVGEEFDGRFVSNEYPTFDCDTERVRGEFLEAYFKSPQVWASVAAGSKGLGDRRQRVHPEQILGHRVLLPPLVWQNRITDIRRRVSALESMQAETRPRIDALLASVLERAFTGDL